MRIDELQLAARTAAEKVRRTGAPYRFGPMSSRGLIGPICTSGATWNRMGDISDGGKGTAMGLTNCDSTGTCAKFYVAQSGTMVFNSAGKGTTGRMTGSATNSPRCTSSGMISS